MAENKIFDFIRNEINEHEVVLFMKGTADFPQCGFSAMVVSILQSVSVRFKDHNVLANEELRQGIKEFSDWPTIPQLYIKGEFIGGCDIVREMYENGSLSDLVKGLVSHGVTRHNGKRLESAHTSVQLTE
ncbi:MAG: Grx4 family monothiol glutaredoxin [Alphaproteobacteria bacterium]|jgi:monothiol glutaredoxin|nr:Grx4 family monothiol glutaredoxin [Alphaproteobacteria bacterium]MCP5363122.1 Grx4 family monothiol glutaredoxin [Rickettsiaceae bacterium]